MTVLKHNTPSGASSSAVVLDLSDLGAQAKRLLENARSEAQTILSDARSEAEQIRRDADEKGYAEGVARGEAEGREQGAASARQELMNTLKPKLEQLTESWAAELQAWERSRHDMLLQAREDVLVFAFELAEKIIGRAIAHDPTLVRDQLASALEMLNQPTAAVITVHPDDEPYVREALPELLQQVAGCEHADVVTDAAITRGGCVVRAAGGSVDATIDTQLRRIAEALLPARNAPAETESPPNDGSTPA